MRTPSPPPPRAPRPGISFRGVAKTFGGRDGRAATAALAGIDLDVAPQRFVVVLGPSGCGKTTLLRIAGGLVAPDEGRVTVGGRPPVPGPDIGFVFQSFRLVPWMTVADNVAFALEPLRLGRAERGERVARALHLVGLARFSDDYPGTLSGGMKQRVALARALVTGPGVLLMDEPLASLDAQTRELMQAELMRLAEVDGATVLFVTHSVDEAIVLADEIVVLGPRPGSVVERIDVDLPRPRWAYDARSEPAFVALRRRLAARIRDLVLSDPLSEFHGRAPLTGAGDGRTADTASSRSR